jgi:hypothetical protein
MQALVWLPTKYIRVMDGRRDQMVELAPHVFCNRRAARKLGLTAKKKPKRTVEGCLKSLNATNECGS